MVIFFVKTFQNETDEGEISPAIVHRASFCPFDPFQFEMEGKYILESESEEEEIQDADLDAIKSSITSDGWQLQDIDQVNSFHSSAIF